MKIILLVLFPILCYPQQDSITISVNKLIEIAKEKNELLKKDSINTAVINLQDKQISSYVNLVKQDSVENSLLKLQNKGQANIIDILSENRKTKWYQTKWFYYVLGSASMYFSSRMFK